MSHWTDRVLGFDTETTGVNPREDRIVTAALVLLNVAGEVQDSRSWLINPAAPISPHATLVHGITNEVAERDGMDARTAISEIVATLEAAGAAGVPVVAYNAPFDFTILEAEAERHHISYQRPAVILDPLVLDKAVWKYRKGKRTLSATSALYGVALTDAHEASADAHAGARLAQVILQSKASELSAETLMRLQPTWHEEQSASLETHLRKSNPDAVVPRGWPVYRQ